MTPISNLQSPVHAGLIQSIASGSLAAAMGLHPGDEVLAVNGHPVEDEVEIVYSRDGTQYALRTARDPGQALGIEFTHD